MKIKPVKNMSEIDNLGKNVIYVLDETEGKSNKSKLIKYYIWELELRQKKERGE